MPSLRRHLRLVLLLAILLGGAPVARPAFAQTFTVTNTGDADDGVAGGCGADGCSLREAIRLANQNPGPDTVAFNLPGAGPHRILPATALPAITDDGTTIDGTNLATGSEHTIVLSGEAMAAGGQTGHGLILQASNSVIRDMVIGGFPRGDVDVVSGAAIFVDGSTGRGDNNGIFNNWLGLDAGGSAALNNGRYGVRIFGGVDNTAIGSATAGEGNVISGGGIANVGVGGAGDTTANTNTRIVGNFIGTDATGTQRPTGVDTDFTQAGISIDSSATDTRITDNRIGWMIQGAQSNPVILGILVAGFGTAAGSTRIPRGTVIQRNYIGVTPTGVAIPNRVGIRVGGGPNYGPIDTTIGDPANPAAGRNFIAGNIVRGIEIGDSTVKYGNVAIAGNYVGLTPAGTPLPNGVNLQSDGEGIFVGRFNPAAVGDNPVVTIGPGNVVSSNISFGIRVRSGGHVIRGNFLGTDPAGARSALPTTSPSFVPNLANGAASIWLENGNGVTIGGATSADRNIIAFSGSNAGRVGAGILIDPDAADLVPPNSTCGSGTPCSTGGHTVRGNYIGVRAAGDAALNDNISEQGQRELVRVFRSDGNTISDNTLGGSGVGISIGGVLARSGADVPYPANNNTISDNRIGTRASGLTDPNTGVRNREDGVRLLAGTGNVIRGNLIAFNGAASLGLAAQYHGILVNGAGANASDNDVIANRLLRNGNAGRGNGILVTNATGITISRTETSFNVVDGIALLNGNANRAAPTLTAAAPGSPPTVSGTAPGCDGCTVEIFTSPVSEPGEGPIYLAPGTVSAGAFTVAIPGCQRFLTATLTDAAGNTSPFSPVLDTGAAGPCVGPFTLALSPASPQPRTAAPGSSVAHNHTLTHNVQAERTYTIQITSTLGWASAPTSVTLPPAPAGGTASAPFDVTVTVPLGTANGTEDVTRVRASLGSLASAEQVDTTRALVAEQTPASPAVSPGQTRPFTPNTVTFTHSVTNTGQLSGVFEVVAPTIVGNPAGFSIASATLGQTTLAGGASTTLTIVVNTPPSAPAPGNIVVRFRVGVVGGQQTSPVDDTIVVSAVRSFTFTPEAPQAKSTPAGSEVFFDYTLTNTGNAADSFSVSAAPSGSPNPLAVVGVSATPSLSNLPPGASASVRVTLSVPSGTAASPPDYAVVVSAQGSGGANPPAAEPRTASVTVTGGGAASITPGTGTPDPVDVRSAPGVVTFVNRVTNTGNADVPILVGPITGLPAGWTASVTASTCGTTVVAGAFCEFTVTVNVPQDADAGAYPLGISARADNSGQPGSPPDGVDSDTITVNVLRVRGVELAPDRALTGAPDEILTFTHTLTNTGNGEDDFTLEFSATLPGWNVILTPTLALDVPRNATRDVTLTARVPLGVSAGAQNIITVTATVQGGSASDSVTDTATVASITDADLSPGSRRNLDAGQSVTYTHLVTNTGTTVNAFTLTATNSAPGWSAVLSGIPTAALAPGEQATVAVEVTAPADAPVGQSNTTTLSLFEAGTSDPLLDQEQDVSTVGPAFGVLITPDNTGTRPPESTALFTHTLTNIGSTQGLFSLTGAEANGWPVTVTPNLVNLGPGQSFPIEVRVIIPDGPRAGTRGFARVTAQLVGNPTVRDDATNDFVVARVSGVDLSASQVRVVSLGTPQRLNGLNVYNSGNAFDTFDLVATNVPAGWVVTFSPATVPVDKDSSFRVAVEVLLPASTPRDQIAQITVEARSRSDGTARDSVTLTLIYPGVASRRTVYLPMVQR